MTDDISVTDEQSTPQASLIDKYEEDYRNALAAIDGEVKNLIQGGREMAGLMLCSESLSKIVEVHEALVTLYGIIFNNQEVLKHHGSERLRQLGHEPKAIYEFVKDADASQEDIEKYVLKELRDVGFKKSHWYVKARVLTEVEYMLEALRILIEPDFIPLAVQDEGTDAEDKADRYIPSGVKIGVWRRDGGKCVECGSKEKLEYDHIIPISKGGSNTERNIQLLCEKCNRQKAAAIQ